MLKTLKYQLTFYSWWHCGSGLAAGADVDALVIKDADGLPFVPGKTIKGLVRHALYEIAEDNQAIIEDVFGIEGRIKASSFFSDAELIDRISILEKHLQEYLFSSISNTMIGCDGVAQDGSLRKTEIVVPCVLEGYVADIPEKYIPTLIRGFKYIKNMGLHRNRGLGRCVFTF